LELTGLRLTPQKFRHFLAKHYLRANAGGIGTVQQALGHRSADVTNRSYVGFQNADALRHVDEHVMRKRDASPLHMKRSAKKTPKSL
jgi:integrase